jgi:hypothetical protein
MPGDHFQRLFPGASLENLIPFVAQCTGAKQPDRILVLDEKNSADAG